MKISSRPDREPEYVDRDHPRQFFRQLGEILAGHGCPTQALFGVEQGSRDHGLKRSQLNVKFNDLAVGSNRFNVYPIITLTKAGVNSLGDYRDHLNDQFVA